MVLLPLLLHFSPMHEFPLLRDLVVLVAVAIPVVALAHRLPIPTVRIIVRSRYVSAMEELERAGADEVVPEEFETSIEIFSRVLRLYGVPSNTVQREIDAVRSAHYGVLRGAAPSGAPPVPP